MYKSLNSAILDLRKRGFRLNFFHDKFNHITSSNSGVKIPFRDFRVEESYLFPSLHEEGSQSVLYAIKTKSGLSGILFDYTDHFKNELKAYRENALEIPQTQISSVQNIQQAQISSSQMLSQTQNFNATNSYNSSYREVF